MPIISHTFTPILRLICNDRDQLEADSREIKSSRTIIKLFETPLKKWRKRYGNFVTAMERALWALRHLRLPHKLQPTPD